MEQPQLTSDERLLLSLMREREAAALQNPRTALTKASITTKDAARLLGYRIGEGVEQRLNTTRAEALLGYLALFNLLDCWGPPTNLRWCLYGLHDRIAALKIADPQKAPKAAGKERRKPPEPAAPEIDLPLLAPEPPPPAPTQATLFGDVAAPRSFVRRQPVSYTGPVWRGQPRGGVIVIHLLTGKDGDPLCKTSLHGDWLRQEKQRQVRVTQGECCPRCWQQWIRRHISSALLSWDDPDDPGNGTSPRQDAA